MPFHKPFLICAAELFVLWEILDFSAFCFAAEPPCESLKYYQLHKECLSVWKGSVYESAHNQQVTIRNIFIVEDLCSLPFAWLSFV